MNRSTILRILLTGIVLFSFISSREARAAGFSIGATSFYSWWSPSFKDLITNKTGPANPNNVTSRRHFDLDPEFLVGPALSISLPGGFSISSVFLYGSWFHADSSYAQTTLPSFTSYNFMNLDITKWDLDALLNYQVSRYIRLFTGIKYQGYRYEETWIQSAPGLVNVSQRGMGPGIGANLTLNLVGPLYLMANASALYMKTDLRYYARYQFMASHNMAWAYHTVGFNGAVSIAYVIQPASVTVSLGFRYQYLHYTLWDSLSNDYQYMYIMGTWNCTPAYDIMNDDHFYGITLSAVYTFDFGGDR